MPNHITTYFINSDQINWKTYLSERDNEQFLDFNKIKPIPEALNKVTAPVTLCRNKKEMEESTRNGSYRKISKHYSKKLIETHGHNNWYDWSVENWGTKWNSYDNHITEGNKVESIQTAWASPHPVISQLAQLEQQDIFTYFNDEFSSRIYYVEYSKEGEINILLAGELTYEEDSCEAENIDFESDFKLKDDKALLLSMFA